MTTKGQQSAVGRPRRRSRFALAVAFVAVVGAALGAIPARPSAAASNGQWSVFPATLRGQAPRAFLEPVLTPGKTYADAVTVTNDTAAALTFHLYAADAINTPGGGLSLRRRTDVQRDIGAWIKLPVATLTVAAHRSVVVPFTILTPAQAAPGDHVGGIVAENTQGVTSRSGSVPITIVQAVGVRVYGRVVGPLHPRLALPQMSLSTTGSLATQFDGKVGARVTFRVHNAGNTILSPVAQVVLSTPFGTAAQKRFIVNDLLPGNSLDYSVRFPAVNTYGHLHAAVSVTAIRATANASASAWTLPWVLAAIVVLVLVLLAVALVHTRRRRRARHEEAGEEVDAEAASSPQVAGDRR